MDLTGYKRVVIKVGSALLVNQDNGQVKGDWMQSLCDDIAGLAARGADVLIVSSGAIAMGRRLLKLPSGALDLDQSQASAAVGQIALARAWTEYLATHKLQAAQILLTTQNTEDRRHYLNARATMSTLMALKCIPVINENDTVATAEIRYGDNDRLAARVASMVEADLLILLSDIDGLYTANPALEPTATHIPAIEKITPEIEAMAGDAASEFSRGGMKTKIEAAKIATGAGCAMVIARGNVMNPVRVIQDDGKCTVFKAAITPLAARKKWIAGTVTPRGRLLVDDGAIAALMDGKSLLPAGVCGVDGNFTKGDIVSICSQAGAELARGLVTYDTAQAEKIVGLKSAEIAAILGHPFRTEMVHRDDMVILKDAS